MRIGLNMFPTDVAIDPGELAREAEARGFHSLWFPEHTHIPTSRRTPWPGGTELPAEYTATYDPFVALMKAGAVTDHLLLGTGICLVAQRDPIVLAKEVASVDRLTGGRFLFGIGYGWNEDEMEDHGVDPKHRRGVLREKMLAVEALWRDDVAAFDGRYVSFAPSWSWPKPVQQPRPPVFLGARAGEKNFAHIAEFADGWMPIEGRVEIEPQIPALRKAFEAAGRDPDSVQLGLFGARPKPERLAVLAELGFDHVALGLPPAGRDVVLPVLDRYGDLLAQF